MTRALSLGVTLGVLIGLFLSPAIVRGDAGGAATITLNAPAAVAPGSDFIARVSIFWVQDFDAAQFDVTYDRDVLEVTDVTAGLIGSTTIPSVWGFIPYTVGRAEEGQGHCQCCQYSRRHRCRLSG